jgi:hypothetical protein
MRFFALLLHHLHLKQLLKISASSQFCIVLAKACKAVAHIILDNIFNGAKSKRNTSIKNEQLERSFNKGRKGCRYSSVLCATRAPFSVNLRE